MKRKKVTILLGAGAAIPWGGPSTDTLTTLVREFPELKTAKENINVCEGIFRSLREYYKNHESVNYETILSFIEEIFTFEINRNIGIPETTSFLPLIFQLRKELENFEDFRSFSINPEDTKDRMSCYISPKNSSGYEQVFEGFEKNQYYSRLFHKLISLISNRILDYCNFENINSFSENNQLIKDFLSHLAGQYSKIRFYTTNYDKLISRIVNDDLNVFDGFYDSSKPIKNEYLPESRRIITDNETLSYYNLHGSIYWSWEFPIEKNKPGFTCTPSRPNTYEVYNPTHNVNPGQQVPITNIVTGYNKLQRVSIPPLDLFFYSFRKDLIESDLVITAGYSYSDPHINSHIFESLGSTRSKFIHVDLNPQFVNSATFNKMHLDFRGLHADNPIYDKIMLFRNEPRLIYLNGLISFLKEFKDILGLLH